MIGAIIGAIIVGAIIGVIARLIRPGTQNISMIETVLVGIVSSFAASLIVSLFGYRNTKGIAWIPLIVGVVVAIILIPVYEQLRGRAKA